MDHRFHCAITFPPESISVRKLGGRIMSALSVIGAIVITNVNAAPPNNGQLIRTDLPPGLGCDFALTILQEGAQPVRREFTDKNGNIVRLLTAGKGITNTYINAETGASVTIKPSGGSVAHTTFNTDGSSTIVATGFNGLILFPSDKPAGPTSTLYIGRLVYSVDASGVFTIMGSSGKQTDICAVLSATA